MSFFEFDERVIKLSEKALKDSKFQLSKIEEIQEYNQNKMLKAFQQCGVSESHFADSTGYGYSDRGREVLDNVYATAFGAEDAIVRQSFQSGTHALTVALFGILRPGDTMLSVTGIPYDTIRSVIGIEGNYSGSLKDFGINYDEVPMKDNDVDYDLLKNKLQTRPKMAYIQRSRGYSLRKALTIADIKKIADIVKEISPDTIIMVDNCYGEFVEKLEPVQVGADIMAGSLIKNAGGGIAPTGGYIAGKSNLVEQCSYRLTTPGTGRELGATISTKREMFLGAFNAPHITGEAMKTAVFACSLFKNMGYGVSPDVDTERGDIVQAILLENEENLIAFCQGIQSGSPVDSYVTPVPDDLPGYDSKVIMAAGAFTLGSSIELSADAPLREPFAVWMQGAFNFHSGKTGVMLAANKIINIK
ncbi:MAG: methionine gamma-lyase family protein [Oscillospiraceae bacterium]|nr:methionine gamma-lyase family protein [Oscillospiraceae bacterium]